jgi:hypothetical protein
VDNQGQALGFDRTALGASVASRKWAARGANVFWNFKENAGLTVVDAFSNLPMSLVGSGNFWGQVPGVFLSRSPILAAQVQTTTPQVLLRSIFDLSTLTVDKALTVYGVTSHPAPWSGSSNTLMSWGLMGDATTGGARAGGWSLMQRTTGLLSFNYLAPGSTTSSLTLNDDAPWCGNGRGQPANGLNPTTNTMTAWAVQFSMSNAPNCLRILSCRRQLAVKSPPDTQEYGAKSFYLWPTGATAIPSWNAGGSLCLGAEQGTSAAYAQLGSGLQANARTGMACFGANRGVRDESLIVRIVRDLERGIQELPGSLQL